MARQPPSLGKNGLAWVTAKWLKFSSIEFSRELARVYAGLATLKFTYPFNDIHQAPLKSLSSRRLIKLGGKGNHVTARRHEALREQSLESQGWVPERRHLSRICISD